MRYHFQQMKLICTVASGQTDAEALQELNAYRRRYFHPPYEIVGQRGDRIYLPSNDLLSGDEAFFKGLCEDSDYDGISAYYDSVEESKACFSLLSGPATKFYYIVVHAQYAIFVRKEEQLIQDVERFVKAALPSKKSATNGSK